MSLILLLIGRQTKNFRSLLLRPLYFSPRIFCFESSTLKSKYSSLKPSSSSSFQNPFREPNDEKSRRLKLQKDIRFREKFQLENDYQLIYTMPQQRMYSLMHFTCICATVTMFVFVILQLHRDLLDLEPLMPEVSERIPLWVTYSMATVIGSVFALVLVLISRMPVRLYYSPVRQSYALFYHPIIGVFRQKKIRFRTDQYSIIPQKLDHIESAERSMKIRLEFGQGLFRTKQNFYLIENLFRSTRDIRKIRMKGIDNEEIKDEQTRTEEETTIWETVLEKKDQLDVNPRTTQRRNIK